MSYSEVGNEQRTDHQRAQKIPIESRRLGHRNCKKDRVVSLWSLCNLGSHLSISLYIVYKLHLIYQ